MKLQYIYIYIIIINAINMGFNLKWHVTVALKQNIPL